MTVKLTAPQHELLRLMGDGPREGITDKRVANALGLKGLVSYAAADDAWSITPAGRALLSPEAPASSKEEADAL